jgi:hypothetical protein
MPVYPLSKFAKNYKFIIFKILGSIIAIILLILATIYLLKTLKRSNFQNAFFDCKIQVTDIDPRIADNYKIFQDKVAKCGGCANGKVDITVSPCPTTATGEMNEYCKPKISITGYNDSNVNYIYKIDPDNLSKFLCLSL